MGPLGLARQLPDSQGSTLSTRDRTVLQVTLEPPHAPMAHVSPHTHIVLEKFFEKNV